VRPFANTTADICSLSAPFPWALTWPDAKPIFYSKEASGQLDFVSVHFYPRRGEVAKALKALAVYDIGKPLVIEDAFPLECGLDEMDDFFKRSKDRAEGYISFYWGRTVAEYDAATDNKELARVVSAWLKYFQKYAEFMKRP